MRQNPTVTMRDATPGGVTWPALLDAAPESAGVDLAELRRYRLGRVRTVMAEHGIGALVLCDAVNIRYATGTRNMQVFTSRNAPSRYLLLTDARSILYEFTGCEHLADGFDTVDEVRPALTASFVAAGAAIADRERQWADQMAGEIRELLGPGNHRVGLERMNAGAAIALAGQGLSVVDAQQPVELARCIKSDDEITCVRRSLELTERAVATMRESIRPGMTENELWSILQREVIAGNGDYCETRLLNSGPRTNPWFQETSSRTIQANELICLDTDVVGCHGYYADFSRTFHVGPDAPTAEQRRRYRIAHEQVEHNVAIIEPGMSFREYSERAWDIPAEFDEHRYYLSAHGCGMTGEYPYLYHRRDFEAAGYDGIIEAGMTLCVESYIGSPAGGEGVKLEQQLLVTDTGTELLSTFPFETALLA